MREAFFLIAMMFGLLSLSYSPASADTLQNISRKRPTRRQIEEAVVKLPDIYQKEVQKALQKAGSNGSELIKAVEAASSDEEKEGVAFLLAQMPRRDLRGLDAAYVTENVQYALEASRRAPWGKEIPQEIFLNEILPYVSLNERRDRWRKDFFERFMTLAEEARSIHDAVILLNTQAFQVLQVEYHATKRPKPNQSPYESMQAHYASCTGLSILLIDVLRAVGIPARAAGIPLWRDNSGNHTWVEVWDQDWNFIGAAESEEYNETWFAEKAALTDPSVAEHRIYASSFKSTGLSFPSVWNSKIGIYG